MLTAKEQCLVRPSYLVVLLSVFIIQDSRKLRSKDMRSKQQARAA